MANKGWLFIGVIALSAMGYFRDFVFININTYLVRLQHSSDIADLNPWFSPLAELGYQNAYWLKWLLTLFFIMLFYSASYIILSRSFGSNKILKGLKGLYLLLFTLSILTLALGYLIDDIHRMYAISRKTAGWLQSVIPLLILGAWGLFNKMDSTEDTES